VTRPAIADPGLGRRCAAEFVATFVLVFAGCGAVVTNTTHPGSLGTVGVALVFGLVVMALIYATGHLSGAHFNPAVTLVFVVTRGFPRRDAAGYVAAQFAGAVAGALLLVAAWPAMPAHLGATVPTVSAGTALLYETAMTAILLFVVMAVATDTREVGATAALAVGGIVAVDAMFGGPISGASMNPARSFGPALVSGTWTDFWVFVVGPIVGAGLGALAYQLLRAPGDPPSPAIPDDL
jgi:MIP family channel proteins